MGRLVLIETAFWICAALVVWVYAGYPLAFAAAARVFGRGAVRPEPALRPSISVIIAAYNEAEVIADRLQNLLALEYPAGRLEILIASDGSTDGTCDIVRRFASPQVRLLAFPANRGKAAVLNDAVSFASGDIILLSDANTMLDPQAADVMSRWFSDPRVGVVCGRLELIDARTGANADGLYWRYETYMKRREAQLDALLGANGAIYAIRRSLFPVLPEHTAVDDFVVPLLARLNSGCRIVYDMDARATEETAPDVQSEFTRRSRIGAGAFRSLGVLWPLLNPRHGWIAPAFFSHKVLRWLCPFFLIGLVAASVLLAGVPRYQPALALQLALYGIAVAVYCWPQLGSASRVARLPTMFAAMNLALLAGFFQWVSRRQQGAWQRTARTESSPV